MCQCSSGGQPKPKLLLLSCKVYVAADLRSQTNSDDVKNAELKNLLYETDVATFSIINIIAKKVKSKETVDSDRATLAADDLQHCITVLQIVKELKLSTDIPERKKQEIREYLAQTKTHFHDDDAVKEVDKVYAAKGRMKSLYESHSDIFRVGCKSFSENTIFPGIQ